MKQAIQILEFNKIKQTVDSLCACSLGQKRVEYLSPSIDEKQVEYSLNQSDEALKIILALGEAPLGGVTDITEAIKRAKISAMLSAQELLGISRLLYAVSQLKTFSERLNEIKVDVPIFSSQVNSLVSLNSLQTAINDCIDETGYILDSASSELRNIRRSIQSTEARIKEKLNHVVSERRNKLTDGIVTIRNERYVVPVRAEAKNTFGGTVHDQSSSGNTYFIEPKEVVDLNNKLQEYHVEERREIERILRALTEEVKKFVDALAVNVEVLGEIDFMFAKGKYARLINGTRPKMNTKGIIRLVAARHPLIDQKVVVPNDIELGDEYTTIVITGPNTGGKTVTLKTVGLLTLMAQAGLLIPAHETSQLAIFDHVFADIGDEQSIEQSLSTFSSHMTNIVRIMERLTVNSLILFDELGAGTDPKEGASLAISILEYLIEKGCTVITSTHYSQVKSFGKANDHVLVSSVEFDSQTLQPTYKYIPGVSGASYAFLIAHNYHLPDSIIQRADEYKKDNEQDVQRQLEKLEKLQNDVLVDKERFNKMIKQAHQIQKDAYQEKEKWEKKNKELQEEYEQRLHDMLEEKENEANEIIQTLKKQKTGKLHEQSEALHQIHVLQQENTQEEEKQADESLKVGDYVQIESLNSHGEILDIRKKEATVLVNGMKMKVKLNRLKRIQKPNVQKVPKKVHQDRNFTRFPLELNLIGMRVEEAIQELDRYIDQAIYHKVKQVRIIHGMGTGALRSAVWKDLDKHPMVVSKMSAGPNEGGLGATVVLLK